MPLAANPVQTIQVVCSHGLHDAGTPESLGFPEDIPTAVIAGYCTAVWLGEEHPGEHIRGWLINWGTSQEFAIRMTDDYGAVVDWNRCPDAEVLLSETTVSWSFHSSMPLNEWATANILMEAFNVSLNDIAISLDGDEGNRPDPSLN